MEGLVMSVKNLRKIMKMKNMGNLELSRASGIPLGTLNKIIYGETKSPTLDNMQAIAKALDCTLDDFVRDYEPTTIAAHHDSDEWTTDEIEEIDRFKDYVRSKRNG